MISAPFFPLPELCFGLNSTFWKTILVVNKQFGLFLANPLRNRVLGVGSYCGGGGGG